MVATRSAQLAGAALVVIGGFAAPAHAQLFDMRVTVFGSGGEGGGRATTSTRTFKNIDDATKVIRDGTFGDVNAAYTDTSIMNSVTNIRGLAARVDYLTPGTALTFSIPSIGETRVFQGATRADSEQALEDFLRDNESGLLTRILQQLAQESPVDPVAGNPNSLQTKMVEADFGIASGVGTGPSFATETRTGGDAPAESGEEGGAAPNLIGYGARLGSFSAGDFDSTVVDLPLGYVIPLADPRWAVNLSAPLTYVETDDTDTYAASLGVGLRVPVLDNWSITPAVRFGATGSKDLGAAGLLYSGSIVSSYQFDAMGLGFRLGNSVAVLQTVPIEYDNTKVDYDITNFVTRNGLGVSGGLGRELFGQALTWEAAFVNTAYFGDALYVENASEVSFTIGTEASRNGLVFDSFRLGVSYTFTDTDYDGFRLSFGAQF